MAKRKKPASRNTYEVLAPLDRGGQFLEIGDLADFDEKTAEILEGLGVIRSVLVEETEPEQIETLEAPDDWDAD